MKTRIIFLILTSSLALGSSGECVNIEFDPIVRMLNHYSHLLTLESDNWESVMRDLSDDLWDLSEELSRDADSLLQRGIGAFYSGAMQQHDFIARRMQQGIDELIYKRKLALGRPDAVPPPVLPPVFTLVDPETIQIKRIEDGLLDACTLFGYDFDHEDPSEDLVRLWLITDTGEAIDVTEKLNRQTHYKLIVNLGGNGVPVDRSSDRLQLTWDGEVLGEVPIIQPQVVQFEKEVHLGVLGPYVPPHTRGDADFAGHGPNVHALAFILVEDNKLYTHLYMKAEEWENGQPRHDYTTAQGWSDKELAYTPSPGERIVEILSSDRSDSTYVDTNHDLYFDYHPSGGLVQVFEHVGDTDGSEAGTRTSVTVTFCDVRLLMEREE